MVDYKELYSQTLQRELKLEIENAELKDRLYHLGEDVKKTPNDMMLGEIIRQQVQLSIFDKSEKNSNQLELF
tara:strand:- start:22 stop:237 length:216 start_codon:yes stop_codon:yes gene_type:complete